MDKNFQRLQVAQTCIQGLVNLIIGPAVATHAQVQSVLDTAAAQLKTIDAQPALPQPPVTVPNFVPPATSPATSTTTTTPVTPSL